MPNKKMEVAEHACIIYPKNNPDIIKTLTNMGWQLAKTYDPNEPLIRLRNWRIESRDYKDIWATRVSMGIWITVKNEFLEWASGLMKERD